MKRYVFKFFDENHTHVDTQWFHCISGNLEECYGKADEYAYRYGYYDYELKEESK